MQGMALKFMQLINSPSASSSQFSRQKRMISAGGVLGRFFLEAIPMLRLRTS
jgi:hypothetical protein